MALTRRQKQVLDFLVGFINRQGYSPSFEEIAEGLKLSSLATVHKHLETLEKKGFIRRRYNRSRSVDVVAVPGSVPFAKTAVRSMDRESPGRRPRRAAALDTSALAATLTSFELPLLGRIAAGRPVEAIAQPETISLTDFAGRQGNTFVLRVKGDSMIEDHICDGDYILVEGSSTASNGEIVVALIGGTDATLKRLYREAEGKVRLQPANVEMDPIVVNASDLQIQGRVIGVLRKF